MTPAEKAFQQWLPTEGRIDVPSTRACFHAGYAAAMSQSVPAAEVERIVREIEADNSDGGYVWIAAMTKAANLVRTLLTREAK